MKETFSIRRLDSQSGSRKSKIQNLKWGGFFAIAVIFTLCGAVAQAQQPKKIPRIGYLVASSVAGSASRLTALRQGLRDLGYVEGKNVILEIRSADGNRERGVALAEELVRLQVEVIVSGGSAATRPLNPNSAVQNKLRYSELAK
jgi:hypothetical protein